MSSDTQISARNEDIVALYEQYQQPLLGFLTGIVYDRALAEDICHESFARALKYWANRESDSNVKAWLYSIARNAAYDELRRQRRWRSHSLDDQLEIADTRVAVESAVSTRVSVEYVLRRLPADEHRLLVMHHHEGRSLGEIGVALSLPITTTKTRLFRARARFRAAYEEA